MEQKPATGLTRGFLPDASGKNQISLLSGQPGIGKTQLACRACGSTKTRAELDALKAVSCCPGRAMNEVIERDHRIPASLAIGKDSQS